MDVLLVATAAAAVTWAAATAPWWSIVVTCAIAGALSAGVAGAAAAVAGLLVMLAIGVRGRNIAVGRAVAAALAVQSSIRLGDVAVLGFSAFVGCTSMFVLFVLGVRNQSFAVRDVVRRCLLVVAGIGALSALGLISAALLARAPLRDGSDQAHLGIDALDRGDLDAAADAFAAASTSFRDGHDQLSTIWAQPGRLLPIVAQNREAAVTLAAAGAAALSHAATALRLVDPDTLHVVGGTIDLGAVRALVEPFVAVSDSIDMMQTTIAGIDSQWLVAPLQHRLDDVSMDLLEGSVEADNALRAVELAPSMLGADAPRHYFIAFTTSAEARGGGGFMGNYAELTIAEGHVELSAFGRHTDLDSAGTASPKRVVGLGPFMNRWGKFLDATLDGTVGHKAWAQITMAPDFPTTAELIAQLYPQSGGRQIDGVFEMDPQALAALVSVSGPLDIPGVPTQLTSENLADFIISGQYEITANDDRIDLLDVIAHTALEKLLAGSLPPPTELAALFGPVSRQGGLKAWSADAAEQELFERIGLAHPFPTLNGNDGVAVTVDNASGNKIDAYLSVATDYDVTVSSDGAASGTVTVTLTNGAPATGLPSYVIDNVNGLPAGTNRMYLSIYTALLGAGITEDGRPSTASFEAWMGWNVASNYVEVPAGGTKTIVLSVRGTLDAHPYSLTTWSQPMALAQAFSSTFATG